MTKKLLFIFALTMMNTYAQTFQKSIEVSNKHYHNLNIEPIDDGSNHYIVGGNLFDSLMQDKELVLKRIDQNGNIIWIKKYTHTFLKPVRVFDIENYKDLILITGSIDVSGAKKTFIAKIDALSGALLGVKYYDIVSPNFNSRGLYITFTDSDSNGDSSPDLGFVVGGFFSDCYNVDSARGKTPIFHLL